MINQILHVRSRCGGGKSQKTIAELVNFILAQSSMDQTYVVASRSNDLTAQNHTAAEKAVHEHHSGKELPIQRIDSDVCNGSVSREITTLLKTDFRGIIFISHSKLASIKPEVLRGTRVVVDEIPQELVKCLMVKHAAKDHGYPWDQYLIEVASNHKGYTAVELNPSSDVDDIQRYIEAIRHEKDTATTHNVADLLEFLLLGYEAIYTTTTHTDGSLSRVYQAVQYHRLVNLAMQIDFLAILSAQLEDSLFGYVAQHRLNLPIVEKDINEIDVLVQKHKNRVRIFPFLEHGRWSTTLRLKPAKDELIRNNQPAQSNSSVRELAQEFSDDIIGQEDYIITLNKDDKQLARLTRPGVELTTTAVQGMNHLRHFDHAAFLASTNPTPFDEKSLRMFAKDHHLDGDGLIQAVIVERCYETAYQCVARTSIRNQQHDPDKEHIFIVPDMNYAEYLAAWFEPGCATIDTQYSYTTSYKDEQNKKKENRRNVVTHILMERSRKKEYLYEIIAKAGIDKSTFKRYREEFRAELERDGLIPPKRIPATSPTTAAL